MSILTDTEAVEQCVHEMLSWLTGPDSGQNDGIVKTAAALRALAAERDRLAASAERMRAALTFYADISKYPAPLTGGMGALWSDCGIVARTALGALTPADFVYLERKEPGHDK